jgi:hypothetical protein
MVWLAFVAVPPLSLYAALVRVTAVELPPGAPVEPPGGAAGGLLPDCEGAVCVEVAVLAPDVGERVTVVDEFDADPHPVSDTLPMRAAARSDAARVMIHFFMMLPDLRRGLVHS